MIFIKKLKNGTNMVLKWLCRVAFVGWDVAEASLGWGSLQFLGKRSWQFLFGFARSVAKQILASRFVVDKFGDVQIYNQNRGHNSSKKDEKSMQHLKKFVWGVSGGSRAAILSRVTQIIQILCLCCAFWPAWPILGAVLARTGFRRANLLGISQGLRRSRKH